MKEMKSLTIGNATYEIVDDKARKAIQEIQQNGGGTGDGAGYADSARQSSDEARAAAERSEAAAARAEAADTAADQSAQNASQSWASAENAKTAAETAKNEAQALKNEVEQKLANGDYKGEKGDKGDPGTGVAIKSSAADCTVIGDSYIDKDTGHLMVLTVLPNTFSDAGEIKGEKGDKGDTGTSVTVSRIDTSSADGGSNVVTFSDGKTLTVKNGSTGSPGANGKSAYAYAKDGGYAGTEAEFAEKLAQCGSTTSEDEDLIEVVVNYFDKSKLVEGKSINSNGTLTTVSGTYAATSIIPFPEIHAGDTFVFVCRGRTIDLATDGVRYVFYDANNTLIGNKTGISGYGCPAFYMDENKASQVKGYALEFKVDATGASAYDYTYIHDIVDDLMLIRLNDGVNIFTEYVPYLETATIPRKHFSTDKRAIYDGKFMCGAYSDGYGGYPSNTAESYELAARLDFDVIKGDVRITSDGVLVMCHDPAFTLTNGKISGVYSTADFVIRDHTFDEVRALEYSAKSVHPSTLEELLVICKKYGKIPLITIRDEYLDEVIPKTFELLEKYDMVSSAILNSVTWNTIVALRRYNADIMLSHPQRCRTDGNPSVLELCAMVMLMDSLGNCIYNCYCSLGSNTSDTEFMGSLDKAMPAIELAKNRGLRVWAAMTTATQTEKLIERGIVGTFGWNTYTATNKKEVVSASVSNGVISFKNLLGDEQFKVALPVYDGGVS